MYVATPRKCFDATPSPTVKYRAKLGKASRVDAAVEIFRFDSDIRQGQSTKHRQMKRLSPASRVVRGRTQDRFPRGRYWSSGSPDLTHFMESPSGVPLIVLPYLWAVVSRWPVPFRSYHYIGPHRGGSRRYLSIRTYLAASVICVINRLCGVVNHHFYAGTLRMRLYNLTRTFSIIGIYPISPCTWLRDYIQRASAISCLLESEIACLPKLVVGAGGRVQGIMGFTGTPSDLGYECHINSALSKSSRASVARSRGELEDCTALFSNERISDGIKIMERDPPVFDDDDDQHHNCGAKCGLDSYPVEKYARTATTIKIHVRVHMRMSYCGKRTRYLGRSAKLRGELLANFSEETADDQVATIAGGLRAFESSFEDLH
ncbi:hypothetical protein EDD85DRAFT_784843 [Armillaria nabsnona]|nr:hypothetical protein EDD85DRAFT_784843 [Armillaria nabsnona]